MKKFAFSLLFVILVIVSVFVPLARIAETNKYFTLYEFFGPLPAAFLGPVYGAIAVIIARGFTILNSTEAIGLFDIARIFTMVFATLYFVLYKKNQALLFVPAIAMLLFIVHPIGSQAWYYSLYWLIPIIAYLLPNNLFIRSLGSTFMAHAVGSIAFLYTFATVPSYWIALIPIVAMERLLFAAGIAVSFVALNTLLDKFFANDDFLAVDKRYVLMASNFNFNHYILPWQKKKN